MLLSFFYRTERAFYCVTFILENDVWNGYLIRILHLNFATAFFLSIYIHLFRNLCYSRYTKMGVWSTGVTLLLVLIITAFLGYVLPWGQISFWGASVITSFLTVIPYIGTRALLIIWSAFRVGHSILSFFFSVHYLLPIILLAIVIVHLIYLHSTGRRNKIYRQKRIFKKPFNSFLLTQDIINLTGIFLFLEMILIMPFIFDDAENAKIANEISSPLHIQPEWYFLFAYAILRSVPNKLGGVIAIAVRVLYFYLFIYKKTLKLSKLNRNKLLIWITSFILLTWIGGNPVEDPYIAIGQLLLVLYFIILYF